MLFAKPARVRISLAYKFCIWVLRPPMMLFTRRDWRGAENLDIAGGVIVCCNHLSNFDPLVLGHFLHDNGRPPRFLAKSQLFKVKLIGPLIRAAGQIPVYRGTANAANALRDAEAALMAGEAAVIYPEGTLTYEPNLWPMTGATGAARLALATGAPVIPVAQWGSQLVIPRWRKGLNLWQRHTMHVLAGPPVDLSDLQGRSTDLVALQTATTRIMQRISEQLAVLRKETAPAELWDRRVETFGPDEAGVE